MGEQNSDGTLAFVRYLAIAVLRTTRHADPVIHHSPLCQVAVHDGVKLDLAIYKDDLSGWILEVVNERGSSFVWKDQFDTDVAAFEEFTRTLETEGLAALADE